MNILKRIPIRYKGELHDVRLINFSVDLNEVTPHVPHGIKVRDFGGRAMISMVDVKLKNMRPAALPFLRFNYRHVAFRLLVDDSASNNGRSKGIFFLRSFTSSSVIAFGGSLMTDYNLHPASIQDDGKEVRITQNGHATTYRLSEEGITPDPELKATIGALDRAYAVSDGALRVTEIQRERWPIQWTGCTGFETTFFRTARFEGAFRVPEVIYYDWFPPKKVAL